MMKVRWDTNMRIEDPRKHSLETVEKLRMLLADEATVSEDPHRSDFYEVRDDSTVYYIYASPITGKIYLLASWQNEPSPVTV